MTKRTDPQPLTDPTAPGAWMTVEEVLALLDVARSTLDKWRARPDAPFPAPKRLPNGAVRYLRVAVSAWLDALPDAA